MLRVWWTSGKMLAEFPVDGLADVKSLKQDLRRKCGVPRFRQRLMNAETILDDDTRLVSPMDVHLISLPFISASGEQRDELIELIFEDAVAQVEEILQRPQDPDLTASEEGENPLMLPIVFAASLGHTEIVRLLAEAGADINELGGHGHPDHYQESATALIKACEHGHLETSRVLLELGACVDEYEGAECATALIRAAEQGHVDIVRLLIAAEAQVNQKQRRGRTALVCACFRNHLETARVLVEAKADVNVPDNLGMTALSWTSGAGHVEVVQLLLQARAAPELESDAGLTAAMCASMRGRSDIAGLLLEVCDAPDCAPMKTAAIAAASIMGQTQTLQFLLDARAGTDVPDDGRCVAVICAAATGHVETVRMLLKVGVGVTRQYTEDTLALLSAADRGNVALARVLLENGVSMHAGHAGLQGLVSAAINGHEEMVALLLQAQAGTDVVTDGGRAAIACICAASQDHRELGAWLIETHSSVRGEMVGNEWPKLCRFLNPASLVC